MIDHDGDPDGYTRLEAIRSAWWYYIPATIVGTSTIMCIFGANVLNKRQQVAMSSAYALISNSYNEYKSKLKELYGKEAHDKIVDAIASEKAKDVYISSCGFLENSTLTFDDRDPNDTRLFYDSFSERYFESTCVQVLEAEYHLNRNWILGGEVSINDLYNFLGISTIEGGDDLHWFWSDGIEWIDFNHRRTVLDDGLEVYIVDLVFPPRYEKPDDYC
jgi:hypothetical protein